MSGLLGALLVGVVTMSALSAGGADLIRVGEADAAGGATESVPLETSDEQVLGTQIWLSGTAMVTNWELWCPGSHPFVKQTVQAPILADGEDPAQGWRNVFPGVNGKLIDGHLRIAKVDLPTGQGRWGVSTTVEKDSGTPSGAVEIKLHCTNNSAYNPYAIKATGTLPQMHYGEFYDHQVTLTGPGNPRVKTATVTGLPAGLIATPGGRIIGTPTQTRWGDQTITIPIESDYIKVRPGDARVTIPRNFEIISRTHHYGWGETRQAYSITCPSELPYIDPTVPGSGDPRAVTGMTVSTKIKHPDEPWYSGGLGSDPVVTGSPASHITGWTDNGKFGYPGHITVTLNCTSVAPPTL